MSKLYVKSREGINVVIGVEGTNIEVMTVHDENLERSEELAEQMVIQYNTYDDLIRRNQALKAEVERMVASLEAVANAYAIAKENLEKGKEFEQRIKSEFNR